MWPRTDRSTRMAAAALIWAVVGGGLAAAGTGFLLPGPAGILAVAAAAGVGLGILKGRFLLAKMARENAGRIASGPDVAWLGSAYAPSSWGVALFFMVTGIAIRRAGLPAGMVGFIYIAAGVGLLYSSVIAWSAWRAFRAGITKP